MKIEPCPNPECDGNTYWITDDELGVGFVTCECGYRGPEVHCVWQSGQKYQAAKAEAIRLHNLICRPSAPASATVRERTHPIGELRDWIDLLRLLRSKGEFLVGTQQDELANYLETLGDYQVMREALTFIAGLSGLDNVLVKGADKFVFARMGDIHQESSAALVTVPSKASIAPQAEGRGGSDW